MMHVCIHMTNAKSVRIVKKEACAREDVCVLCLRLIEWLSIKY